MSVKKHTQHLEFKASDIIELGVKAKMSEMVVDVPPGTKIVDHRYATNFDQNNIIVVAELESNVSDGEWPSGNKKPPTKKSTQKKESNKKTA